ncbi:MAG TPA: LamB/YcsF family protein, partial [Chitinophagaceae bacterium]|nr:LamB/YcsF family protein [Chitinophagaceae bacterium]
ILYGLSGSYLIKEAKNLGLKTASEVFADRTYKNDGSLISRSKPGALIEDTDKAVAQVLQMIKEGTVTSITGKKIPLVAETICIHGDGGHAVEFAKAIHAALIKEGIEIKTR